MGTASETHTYIDTNGISQTETWTIPDQQSVSFSGTVTGIGSNLSFTGSNVVTVQAAWKGSNDFLPPNDPHHQSGPGEGPFALGFMLDTSQTRNVHGTLV
jgi:hypothetical protein